MMRISEEMVKFTTDWSNMEMKIGDGGYERDGVMWRRESEMVMLRERERETEFKL